MVGLVMSWLYVNNAFTPVVEIWGCWSASWGWVWSISSSEVWAARFRGECSIDRARFLRESGSGSVCSSRFRCFIRSHQSILVAEPWVNSSNTRSAISQERIYNLLIQYEGAVSHGHSLVACHHRDHHHHHRVGVAFLHNHGVLADLACSEQFQGTDLHVLVVNI